MCRLLAYRGPRINLDQLIYQPSNSLVHQSYDAKELEEPLNGDGFGVGWYVPELDPKPAIFVSTSPAWSNRNLRHIAPKILSPNIFAHVRAASVGDTSEANCHPFQFENFMFMHNGSIGGFEAIKRSLRHSLSDEIYHSIRGQTDSEHLFAVFLDIYKKKKVKASTQALSETLRDAIGFVEDLKKAKGIKETSYLNLVLSDGESTVAARFISDSSIEALSLYYSTGSRYVCEEGVCHMVEASGDDRSVLIVSERITSGREDWRPVPKNHFITVDPHLKVGISPI